MPTFNEHVLKEAGSRGEKLLVDDLVVLIERYEGGDPGVERSRVQAYAERLAEEDAPVDPTNVDAAIDERLSESERWTTDDSTTAGSWYGSGTLYELPSGRVSAFPATWHDRLHAGDDLTTYMEIILDDTGDHNAEAFDSGGVGDGVPENVLLNAATIIGGMEWRDAKDELESLRDDGLVAERADQHPNSRVRFTEQYANRQ